jgi:hypothetical protein
VGDPRFGCGRTNGGGHDRGADSFPGLWPGAGQLRPFRAAA